jgi:hypothetical protein
MLVLGIETSTRQVSVALGTATELVGAYLVGRGGSPDRVLVPSIERLLSDAGVRYRQLGGIAVGLGPGLFPGLRVGVATAKALAQEIEEKMLRPIELVLRNELGIDVKLIHFAKEAALEQSAAMPPAPAAPAPTLIASPEVAHPPVPKPGVGTGQAQTPVRSAPVPPPIAPRQAPTLPLIQPKAASDITKETQVPFKVAKVPTWGPPAAPPPPESRS